MIAPITPTDRGRDGPGADPQVLPWHAALPAIARGRCETASQRLVVTVLLERWGWQSAQTAETAVDPVVVVSIRALVRSIYGPIGEEHAASHRRTLREALKGLERARRVRITPRSGPRGQRRIDLTPLLGSVADPCLPGAVEGTCAAALLCGACCTDGSCALCRAAVEFVRHRHGDEVAEIAARVVADAVACCSLCGCPPATPDRPIPSAYAGGLTIERSTTGARWECAVCGDPVPPRRRRYCSNACYHLAEVDRAR